MSIINKEQIKNTDNTKFKKLSLELRKNLQRRKGKVKTQGLKQQEINSTELKK